MMLMVMAMTTMMLGQCSRCDDGGADEGDDDGRRVIVGMKDGDGRGVRVMAAIPVLQL